MPDFDSIRDYIDVHAEELARGADDPARLRRELDNLRRYWADEDDPRQRLEETWRVLRAHPSAWAALGAAGLTDDSSRPTAPNATAGVPNDAPDETPPSPPPAPRTAPLALPPTPPTPPPP